MIEPHKCLLEQPEEDTLLYKVMPSKIFFKMLGDNCLHFKRVDTYTDDIRDSVQPPADVEMHNKMFFESHPSLTLSEYYNRCRSRTYACCFSLKNTKYIWDNYSYGDNNSICVVFNFRKLRERLNCFYESAQLQYLGRNISNFLYINYGKVVYSDFQQYAVKGKPCPCPIEYAYLKHQKYEKDQELRITLSALLAPADFNFSESLGFALSLAELLKFGAVVKILINEKASKDFPNELTEKLELYGINVKIKALPFE